ncbi:MAG: hypothetical protein VX603_10465 [Gemmatimonadota bacterium]|jgi:predicted alpha/beta superfamily hydrolase|nr:hypothetical protein [Gemmatimonadota bacterium]|tara:strand:+ start:532 stop:783 length:252 start_codon:yes stop_codon:yes gene_type:complete
MVSSFGIYALSKNYEMFNALILSNPFWITSSRETLMRTFSTALNEQDYSNTFLMISYEENESQDAIHAISAHVRTLSRIYLCI